MAGLRKYDKIYADQLHALGDPFAYVIACFEKLEPGLRVLDLGAGQGRDALPLARMGFRVLAVDYSQIGLDQLASEAKTDGLVIETICADLTNFTPDRAFDVLLADRTFHMLKPEARRDCLVRCLSMAVAGAHAVIVDEKRNISGLKDVFVGDEASWRIELENKGFLHMVQES